jgi:hypothetical protein
VLKKSLIVWFLSVGTLAPATAQECLHGPNRTPADRGRADQAIQFARRLNAEQQLTFPTQQGRYRPCPLDSSCSSTRTAEAIHSF